MSYVLNVSPLIITSCSVVDNILLIPTPVVELMTMRYPLVYDDIVQLTLILCVSLVVLTIYLSASDGTSVQMTVIVVAVLLTRVGREGVNPGAERITFDIM